jgi:hypothetical protein
LRSEATTRIRPRFCNCGGRNQTAFGGRMIRFYLFRFSGGQEHPAKFESGLLENIGDLAAHLRLIVEAPLAIFHFPRR